MSANFRLQQILSKFKISDHYHLFNDAQKQFVQILSSGENIFITGSGGTGKSFCTSSVTKFLYNEGFPIGITALTGIAALNIGGMTLHSFSGIGLGDEDQFALVERVMKNKRARQRILSVQLLLIDEISMASAELLNKIDYIFKTVRVNNKPFGGIQVVFSGDFLQLPPVFKTTFENKTFAFNSEAWHDAKIQKIELKKLIRQDELSEFANFLQKIRHGKAADYSILDPCFDRTFPENVTPIKIFCKNIDVTKFNNEKLRELATAPRIYYAEDTGNIRYSEFFDRNCPAPKILTLKVGAQVMLLKNIDTDMGLVNGALGTITEFNTAGVFVKFFSGLEILVGNDEWEAKDIVVTGGRLQYKTVATRRQLPLKLAWASTVHKVQGQTIDYVDIDFSEVFAEHQVYVGLSRVKTLEGLKITNFHPNQIKVNKECLDFYNAF